MVTLALGARYRIVGATHEFALTDESAGLLDDRYTFDMVISVPF